MGGPWQTQVSGRIVVDRVDRIGGSECSGHGIDVLRPFVSALSHGRLRSSRHETRHHGTILPASGQG